MACTVSAFPQGRISFVIGSDTGIWTGLDVNDYHCTISGALYTSPTGNAARVMDPAFRSGLQDRYGTPMKLTWWMMAGNMFRLSVNTDIPVPSTMPVYLMKRYHGDRLREWGDELTFHFHNWVWTDYDGDGKWYWNQARTYAEFAPDFDRTLAELLLEEEVFPVSFRSGWHAMNNEWQHRLDQLLPYCLHNDWPAVRTDTVEPLDNTYDWSVSPSAFVPFRPSTTDYRIPGDGRGWNVRSKYIESADSAFVAKLFVEATKGIDQVVCLWAHLPEADFPDNLVKVNAAIHAVAAKYPHVDYRYCTAVEAMQAWRRTADTTAPQITVSETDAGETVRWTIVSDEPIFQPDPFVAAKDRYDGYRILPLQKVGELTWTTTVGVPRADIAKLGVAVTDEAGNHSYRIMRYLPDDIYVENGDPGYQELTGSWSTVTGTGFGASIRTATIQAGDSAKIRWRVELPSAGRYNLSIRVPAVSSPVAKGTIHWGLEGADTNVVAYAAPLPTEEWVFLGTLAAASHAACVVTATGLGGAGAPSVLATDAVKASASIRDHWLETPESFDGGLMIIDEPNERQVVIRNSGVQPIHILSARTTSGSVTLTDQFPVTIPPMGGAALTLTFLPTEAGLLVDTLVIQSDDMHHLETRCVIHAMVREYFTIVDNADPGQYAETGSWSFSSAGGHNATSRYAYPAPGVAAAFSTRLKKPGVYEVSEIVPTTVNASVRARYTLMVGSTPLDSAFKDQNERSGDWVRLWLRELPADTPITVRVTDAMVPIVAGKVLRADAVQWQWVNGGTNSVADGSEDLPSGILLQQNWPNPFNPTTTIRYSVAGVVAPSGAILSGVEGRASSDVRLAVYDLLGREVAVLVDERKEPGTYTATWDARGMASGVYFYRLTQGATVQCKKMMIMK